MNREYVAERLRERAENLHLSVLMDHGTETPERERTVEVPAHEFPDSPDEMFPFAAVALVSDPARERVLLLRHEGHQYGWEPPGGKGEDGEAPERTATREVAEETGLTPRLTDLLLVEYLEFDYGEPVTAPVLQAVFAAEASGEPAAPAAETEIPTARWFERGSIPEDAQYRELILEELLD
jgi:ADP-ribose pyrophosphatase YjhB (NUDIX family)